MIAPVLTTERLTLGPLRPEHFETVAAFHASERSRFIGGPKDRAMAWRQLACDIGRWTLKGFGGFAVTETATGRLVGRVGPWDPEGWPEPEIGWDLEGGFEGSGHATEATRAARDWGYRALGRVLGRILGWTTAISLVDPANPASARVALRLGTRHETDIRHGAGGLVQVWRHPAPEALS